MSSSASSTQQVLGFRIKSGRAIAVLAGGPIRSPTILDHREIALCDPRVPGTRQPYHASMGKLETDEAKLKVRRKVVIEAAGQSVAELVEEYRKGGHEPRRAGLVIGSDIDPAKIANPHIRAHAHEGRLFRTALEDALRAHGIESSAFVERNIYHQGADTLKRSEEELKKLLVGLGRGLGGPWRADEKVAALAALLVMSVT